MCNVASTASRRWVYCIYSIARLALLNSQHRFIVLHLQHGQHSMLHLQHPNHRASMLQCQHRAPAFVASTALRRGLAGIAVCWDCNMDYAVFTAPQHPSHSYCICNIIVRRDSVWVIGALSQKNKTRSIGIPLPLSLCYRQCGSDGLEYGYT